MAHLMPVWAAILVGIVVLVVVAIIAVVATLFALEKIPQRISARENNATVPTDVPAQTVNTEDLRRDVPSTATPQADVPAQTADTAALSRDVPSTETPQADVAAQTADTAALSRDVSSMETPQANVADVAATPVPPFMLPCPHCQELIEVLEINCAIFRHAAFRANGLQVPPHAPREECEGWVARSEVYGCARPFRYNPARHALEACDWI
jgi:hypothetical protein